LPAADDASYARGLKVLSPSRKRGGVRRNYQPPASPLFSRAVRADVWHRAEAHV